MAAAVRELRAARSEGRDLREAYLKIEESLNTLRAQECAVNKRINDAWQRVRTLAEGSAS